MAVIISKQLKVPNLWKAASDYAIGDSVYIPVDGTNIEFFVVHQGNPSTTYYDTSCDGTWLLCRKIHSNKVWNSDQYNDYENSTIHAYLNGDYYNSFNAKTKAAIRQVKIPYRPNSGVGNIAAYGASGLSTKAFLLSMEEVGYASGGQWPYYEGAKLDYFEAGGSTSSAKAKRIATNISGTAVAYWTRSPSCSSGSVYVRRIDADGTSGHTDNASTSKGFRPCIIVQSNTKFNSSTNVIVG